MQAQTETRLVSLEHGFIGAPWKATPFGTQQGFDCGEHLGLIPMFLNELDTRPAARQFDENYGHGGGWRAMKGWTMDPATHAIRYDGDPPLKPLAEAAFHSAQTGSLIGGHLTRPDGSTPAPEQLFFYDSSWLAIVQQDGTFEITRMD
jgi:hypothetical protein